MNYAIAHNSRSSALDRFAKQLGSALERAGFELTGNVNHADFVLNLIDADEARPFRRKSRGTFAAAIHEQTEVPDDILRTNYPLLVRALANIVLCYVPGKGVWFTTMERGHYGVQTADGDASLAEAVVDRLAPLARSKLVIDNDFRMDLEPELWEGDEITEQIQRAGARMGDLDLLPAPFPIEELLDEQDLRHVKRLYGVGGLSYGNLSARKDERRFWMSASGVDKSKLETPGRDILLVSDYEAENNRMVLSVPPEVEPRRVSVDAIEHWMIYRAHPGVGAILHVHAWMEGIPATDTNFPCGTAELAESVADLLAHEPDPDHAVIGLRNHGITATGESLDEILDRIEPLVLRQVPMS
ncbi:MAG: class II aldolase/adducin family protein [Actinobacteria bacterium]|nr:MAG: class II aldolase/adducin family protein [Actinomycetota bacterium]